MAAQEPSKQDYSRTNFFVPNLPTQRSTTSTLTAVDALILAESQRRVGASSNLLSSDPLSPTRFPFRPLISIAGRRLQLSSSSKLQNYRTAVSTESYADEKTDNNLFLVNVLDKVFKILAEDDGYMEEHNHSTSTATVRRYFRPNVASTVGAHPPFPCLSLHQQKPQQ